MSNLLSEPVEFPKYYRGICRLFLSSYIDHRRNEMNRNFAMQMEGVNDLRRVPLAQTLGVIARAATGEVVNGAWEHVELLFESLYSMPETSYCIPPLFWNTPIGHMVSKAIIEIKGIELVTMTEAATLSGKSVSALSQMVDRGKLRSYPDMTQPNPTKRNRLLRYQVVELKSPA